MADARALLKRFTFAHAPDAAGEWRAWCPLHEDPTASKTPSASFNFDANVWHCMGCGEGGTLTALIKKLRQARKSGADVIDIKTRTKREAKAHKPTKPLPSEERIRHWHERLLKQPSVLAYLTEERGLTKTTIKEFEIGHDGFRYTIPVRDESGKLVNVRRYDPRKKDHNKMISWGEGYGKARLFRPDLLAGYEEALLVEGEWDMMVGQQVGLPAIAHTAGALTFNAEWASHFRDKVVFICYDRDDTGRKGSVKAARIIAPVAQAVYIMELDIDIKGGDITDYFIKQGRPVEEFRALMEEARLKPFGVKRERAAAPTSGKVVSLEESQSTEYLGLPLEMVVSIAGKVNPPYMVPKKIHAMCDQEKGNVCAVCPMSAWNGETIHNIQPDDPIIVEFVDSNDKQKQSSLRQIIGAKCSDHIEYQVEEHWTVESLQVTNSVEHRTEEQQTPMSRPVLNVGTYKTNINTTARIVGRQLPSPKSQQGLFTSWHLEETLTNLDKFKLTPELIDALRIFRPRRNQSVMDRCRDIAHDMAYNVTRIYDRPELHIAYDLVWHSILDFTFLEEPIGKGWLEMLVVGDTRTGKSEAAIKLARHYNAGVVKSCEGMSFAGLVGGAQQMAGKQWMVTWGTIPLNDRRLVVLDEVSGLKDKDVIENMSAIRSSGKAQLTKIATDEASARTRLIWISNPPDGRSLREVNGGGVEIIQQLVRNPEDIARFDFAMSAASTDVDSDIINSVHHSNVPHRYTDELCAALVMWAWSRKAEDVFWMDGVEEAVVEAAKEFGKRYVPDPPLVQEANVRMKLARIAVALAARTFSTDRTGHLVVVKTEHVEGAVEFLDMLYGMESFGYMRQSRRVIIARTRAEQYSNECKRYLKEHKDDVLHTLLMASDNTFRTRDFEEMGAMDRIDAQVAVRTLLGWRMIRRLSKGMLRMEPALIELIRKFEDREDKMG